MKSYEMVETLSSKANVSLEQAKEALENSNWDILDAALYLERHKPQLGGQAPQNAAPNTAYYVSSQQQEIGGAYATPGFGRTSAYDPRVDFNRPQGAYVPPYKDFPRHDHVPPYKDFPRNDHVPPYKDFPRNSPPHSESVGEVVGRLAGFLENIVNTIFGASFIVNRRGAEICNIPLLIFLIAMFAFLPMMLPVLVLGIAFECKYSFGTRYRGESVSDIIDRTVNSALNTAEKAKNNIMNETQNVRAAYEQSKKEFEEDFKKGRDSVAVDLSKKEN